jgi:hypothetical protein
MSNVVHVAQLTESARVTSLISIQKDEALQVYISWSATANLRKLGLFLQSVTLISFICLSVLSLLSFILSLFNATRPFFLSPLIFHCFISFPFLFSTSFAYFVFLPSLYLFSKQPLAS